MVITIDSYVNIAKKGIKKRGALLRLSFIDSIRIRV